MRVRGMAWEQGRHLLPGPDLPAEARPPPAHHRLPHTDRLQVHFLTLPLYIIQLWALEKASNFFPMYLPTYTLLRIRKMKYRIWIQL